VLAQYDLVRIRMWSLTFSLLTCTSEPVPSRSDSSANESIPFGLTSRLRYTPISPSEVARPCSYVAQRALHIFCRSAARLLMQNG
jgi:hypothetical protein